MRNGKLFSYLKIGHRITALDWQKKTGSMSLVKRIFELRRDQNCGKVPGWIGDETIKLKGGKRCKKYFYLIRQPLIG